MSRGGDRLAYALVTLVVLIVWGAAGFVPAALLALVVIALFVASYVSRIARRQS